MSVAETGGRPVLKVGGPEGGPGCGLAGGLEPLGFLGLFLLVFCIFVLGEDSLLGGGIRELLAFFSSAGGELLLLVPAEGVSKPSSAGGELL